MDAGWSASAINRAAAELSGRSSRRSFDLKYCFRNGPVATCVLFTNPVDPSGSNTRYQLSVAPVTCIIADAGDFTRTAADAEGDVYTFIAALLLTYSFSHAVFAEIFFDEARLTFTKG